MNAESERAFSEQGDQVGRDLWGGRVKIGGREYEAVVVKKPIRLQISGEGGAGVLEVEGLHVEIQKALLPTKPEIDTPVRNLADDELYLAKEVGGNNPNDTSWILTCMKDSAR